MYIWGRSLNQTDLSRLLLRSNDGTHGLRRNEIDEQVNEDIHLTVTILLLGLMFFIACVRYQLRLRDRHDSELHDH